MPFSTISTVKTDEIFTNLLIQHGRKPVDDLNTLEYPSQCGQVSETRVRMKFLRQYGQVNGTRVEHCQEIFIGDTDHNGNSNPKSLLLTGKAGIGKTLFCQKLIRDWAEDNLFKAQTSDRTLDFKFAFLLTFRQLNLLGDDRVSLKDILNCSSVLDDRSVIDDSLFKYIVDHSEEVLIVIDGYDEYAQQDDIPTNLDEQYPNDAHEKMPVAALCAKLMKGNILSGSVVMITSRADESDKIKDTIRFDRFVEITGFSEQQVNEYIEKYFGENENMKNTVLDHVTQNEELVSFAHIPVLCFLMCCYFEYILKETTVSVDALPVKTSDLYSEVVKSFVLKHYKKRGFSPKDTLDKLSELAAQLLLEKKYLFLEEDMKHFSSQEVEYLRASGLLHCGPPFRKSFSETTKHFCFTHMTLQEYLAARWFVKRREIPSKENVSAMVIQFMAGMISMEKEKEFMEELLEAIDESTDTALLTAKCLVEYREKEFAKDVIKKRYRQFCTQKGWIHFQFLTAVDYFAVSFLLDVISALNEEEAVSKHQTDAKQPFIATNLAIGRSHLTRSGVKQICKSLNNDFCTITELTLIACQLNDECIDCIVGLLSKLTVLYLLGDKITDAGVVSLCQALQTPTCKVTTLYLSDNQITDAGVVSLCQALQTPTCKVTTLNLSDNQITDAGVVSLCQALQTPTCKVTTLYLSDNQITDAGLVSLCQALLTPTCKVTTLDLSDNQITDAGVVSLCQALQTPTCKVTTLHLSYNQITNAGVVSLCQALQTATCKLTALDLSWNQITDAGVLSICQALQTTTCKVTTLDMSVHQITDAVFASLSQALKTPTCKVTTLNLSGNEITDAGVASLCQALQTATCKVTTLDLSANQITDAGVVSLCQTLQTPTCKVTTLNLSGNQITDAGVVSLCQALQTETCKITTLDLSDNQITDVGVVSLCQALQTATCKVTTLHFWDNQISDISHKRLMNMLQQKKIQIAD